MMWELNKSVGNSERHGALEERFVLQAFKETAIRLKIVKKGRLSIGSRALIYRKKCKDSCIEWLFSSLFKRIATPSHDYQWNDVVHMKWCSLYRQNGKAKNRK